MLTFCPYCHNILVTEDRPDGQGQRLSCNTCPYVCNVTKSLARRLSTRYYPKKQVVDNRVRGMSYETMDVTTVTCPSCQHDKANFFEMQTRSADEPMTMFYRCCSCGNKWNNL